MPLYGKPVEWRCELCHYNHVPYLACYSAYKQRWEQEHGVQFYKQDGHDVPLNQG